MVFNFNTDVLAFLEFKLEFSASGGYLQTMNHMVGLVDDETWGPTSVVFKGMLFALLVYMIVTRGSLIRKKMRNNKAYVNHFYCCSYPRKICHLDSSDCCMKTTLQV